MIEVTTITQGMMQGDYTSPLVILNWTKLGAATGTTGSDTPVVLELEARYERARWDDKLTISRRIWMKRT